MLANRFFGGFKTITVNQQGIILAVRVFKWNGGFNQGACSSVYRLKVVTD